MTFVNLFNNPFGGRSQAGYSVFGGTIGQDVNADTYVRATGAVNPSNLGIIIEAMTIGDKLAPNTTYTYSATIFGSGVNVRLRVFGTGVTTTDSPDVVAGAGFIRVSATFTTGASGTVSYYVTNSTAAVATNVVAFRYAQMEPGSVANPYVDGTAPNYMWAGAPDGAPTWGPVVTVVANPDYEPPRNEITLSIPPGQVMNAATLNRFVGSSPSLVQVQPATGFDTRVMYDYAAPYDQPCAYQLRTTFIDPDGLTAIWDEKWASLSAWSGDTANWTVSGGQATGPHATSTVSKITRAVSPSGRYRIEVASMQPFGFSPNFNPANAGMLLMSGSTLLAQISPNGSGQLQVFRGSSSQVTTISSTSPFAVDMLGSNIIISGAGGSYSFVSSASLTSIQLASSSLTGILTVGEVSVNSYPQSYTTTETSGVVTLSPDRPWLIHPTNPSLSVPLSSPDRSSITIRNVGDVTNGSAVTEHQILGQSLPITTVSGPRLGNRLSVVLGCRTTAHEQALRGILRDGKPLLFRAPRSYPIGIDEGYYSVGDVTRARISQRLGDPKRNFSLPLTEVQPPAPLAENVGWTWAALAAAFPTWAAVFSAFDTWADVLTNNRNAGF